LVLGRLGGTAAAETPGCTRAVVVTLPAVTGGSVARVRPPNIMRLAEESSIGSIAVRTNAARTSYASGFVTIGAGTRADGGEVAGASLPGVLEGDDSDSQLFQAKVVAGGVDEIKTVAEEADYHAVPGALAEALGDHELIAIGNADPGISPSPVAGFGRWVLLAAMDPSGTVDRAAVGPGLLMSEPEAPFGVLTDPRVLLEAVSEALSGSCSSLIVDQGDLIRADKQGVMEGAEATRALDSALLATDEVIGRVADELDPERDLLLVVSPTSPAWDPAVHLGVAIARGGSYSSGGTLVSASTRRDGIVTLPDIAPTILDHLRIERPDTMIGRPFLDVRANGDRIAAAVELDRESVFTHGIQAEIATSFVVVQISIYVIALLVLRRRMKGGAKAQDGAIVRALEYAALAVVAFPLASYLVTPFKAHALGAAVFVSILIAVDVALVIASRMLVRTSLEQLLVISGATVVVMMIDLAIGGPLQLNAIFGNSPIIAGRFTGLGNLAFSVLGAASLMTGALMVHRWPARRGVLPLVAALFALTVGADGAPSLGSDVGGVVALVPAYGITWLLLAGKKPSLKIFVLAILGGVIALGAFLLVDLSRPPDTRTHLGRLFEDVRARGGGVFVDTIGRKIRTNLRVFRSTIWTYLVPPALAVIAGLLLWPRGRWHAVAAAFPRLRAGLIGGLLLAVLGFSVNDSGIVVPAMVLSFLVPMTLLLHLALERQGLARGS
ncbi:MAG: hypothetical protein ACR2L3_04645, partial [Actinomycetota bacterium]